MKDQFQKGSLIWRYLTWLHMTCLQVTLFSDVRITRYNYADSNSFLNGVIYFYTAIYMNFQTVIYNLTSIYPSAFVDCYRIPKTLSPFLLYFKLRDEINTWFGSCLCSKMSKLSGVESSSIASFILISDEKVPAQKGVNTIWS